MIWNREPALFYQFIQSLIILVTAFGLDLSKEQTGAILLVTGAVLALITRQNVTPVGED